MLLEQTQNFTLEQDLPKLELSKHIKKYIMLPKISFYIFLFARRTRPKPESQRNLTTDTLENTLAICYSFLKGTG
jgi:hypothetical protein